MTDQFEASIVRILDTAGAVAGAGFLVSDRHVLTCAHVVNRALGLPENASETPDAEISLDFPLVAGGLILSARTTLWLPTRSDISAARNGAEDVAALELTTDPPASCRSSRLVTSAETWGHTFRAFGFPSQRHDGVWATGLLRSRQSAGWIHIEDVKEAGYCIEPGFSGTPVWDEALNGVAGMVVAADGQRDVRAAFMIPADTLVEAWPALGTPAIPLCPYRGLFAFREEDAAFYFGRDDMAKKLRDAVRNRPLVALLGASGSGKSSLAFAGLIPRLRTEGTWAIADFRPGPRPFHALASALVSLLEEQMSETERLLKVGELAGALRRGDLTIIDAARRILRKTATNRVLLVVDQFEELYALLETPDDQTPFLDRLLADVQQGELHVVITLRADFLGRALTYRPFANALQDAGLMLSPMHREDLREAVERPASALGVGIEEGLTTRILDAVGEEPGNLPLLEFALTLLWAGRERGVLTHAAYERLGSVKGALAGHAEEVYGRLSDQDKQRAKQILVQLVHPGDGIQDTCRVATRDEVGRDSWDLIARLADARLVVTGREEQTGAETVEIVHEALITSWERLGCWTTADRAFRLWQERLRSALRQWEAMNRDDGALLRGIPLVEATSWRNSREVDLSPDEDGFIEASATAAEEAEREKEAVRLRELMQAQALADEQSRRAEQQERNAKLRGQLAMVLGLAFLLALGLAGFAWYERGRAEQVRTESIRRELQELLGRVYQLLENKQDDLAALLARQAYNSSQQLRFTSAANIDGALRRVLGTQNFSNVLQGHDKPVSSVAFSPAGMTLASGSRDGTARVWDLSHPRATPLLLDHHRDPVLSLAFNPVDRTLATGSESGIVRLWNLDRPSAPPVELKNNNNLIYSVAFSPDGRKLAWASSNAVWTWDLDPRSAPLVAAKSPVVAAKSPGGISLAFTSVAFSHDGGTLAWGGGDGIVRLRNADNPDAKVVELEGHANYVSSMAFSRDDRTLASASGDGTVRLWDPSRPSASPVVLTGHKGPVNSVAFSPDGRTLASAGLDHTVRLWDLTYSASPVVLNGHDDAVSSVAFSRDGRVLASGSGDHTVRLWELGSPSAAPVELEGPEGAIKSVAFSADSRVLASGSGDGTVQLWDLHNESAAPRVLEGHSGMVNSVAFSPDGETLASGSEDRTVRLWDLRTRGATPAKVRDHEAPVRSVAFSPDGSRLASGCSDGTVWVWDLADPGGAHVVLRGHTDVVTSVAFGPDSRTLASGSDDKTVRVWDLGDLDRARNGAHVVLRGHTDLVTSVAFASDGTTLASGSRDRTVRLWQLGHPGADPVKLGSNGPVSSVAFSPDGTTLASGSWDRTVRLWDLGEIGAAQGGPGRDFPHVALNHENDVNSVAFSPDGLSVASGSDNRKIVIFPTVPALGRMACEKSRRNLDVDEWNRLVGTDIPYLITCPNLPPGRGTKR